MSIRVGEKFDFPQGLKPSVYVTLIGTAREGAEMHTPRGLKSARRVKIKGLIGTTEVVP